jgi:aryl-alcohol dehydrogenase-like predicted oxidoreductase
MARTTRLAGWEVFPVGLGGMPLSIQGRPDETRAVAVIKAFIDGGGNFIDTANAYCLDNRDMGHNEALIDRALRKLGVRDRIVVATKGGLTRPNGAWEVDGRPEWLRASCEKSLRDLGVECIDLYQLHAVDPKVPFAETLDELARLKAEGKIRHVGLSNIIPMQLDVALMHLPVVSVQNRCSPLHKRDFATGMVQLCADRGVTFIPHSPVGGHFGHARLAKNPVLREIAGRHGVSAHAVAIAWLLAKGPHILPIPGASRVASIEDSLGAVRIGLTASEIAALDQLPDV